MSTNPDHSSSRRISKVKVGLQADFEQMLSSLPDDGSESGSSELESETVRDEVSANVSSKGRPAVGLQADFSAMLSDLPHSPEDAASETVEEEDFRVKRKGPQFVKPAPRRAEPEAASQPVQKPVEKAVVAKKAAAVEETVEPEPTPEQQETVQPAARKSDPEITPPANIFGVQEDEAAAYLRHRETVVDMPETTSRSARKRTATTTGFTAPPSEPAPTTEASITDLILAELEKYSIPHVSQLRIAVHGGAVTLVGDVPGDYEKQLIVHFCKQVPGVTGVTDLMRVVGGGETAPAAAAAVAPAGKKASRGFAAVPRKAPKAPPKAWKPAGATLQLPFRAKHVGVVAGLIAMVWAGFTFATRDGSRLSVSQVTGKVLVDGAPATGASVVFHPADPRLLHRPRGTVGADGTYKLTTYLPGDGAPSGDYKVTVEWCKMIETPQGDPIPGPNLLPREWSKPETTIHKVTVSGTTEVPPFQVTSGTTEASTSQVTN